MVDTRMKTKKKTTNNMNTGDFKIDVKHLLEDDWQNRQACRIGTQRPITLVKNYTGDSSRAGDSLIDISKYNA